MRSKIPPARTAFGLLLALALPAAASLRIGFTDASATLALALTPWLTLAWVRGVERQPLTSIGLARQGWRVIPLGFAGALVNLAITAFATAACARVGLTEPPSPVMDRLLRRSGLLVVFLATNGALLTEVSFRAYATERLGAAFGGRRGLAALVQIALTTTLFGWARVWAHGALWFVDDAVFTGYYLRTRNTDVCILAHAIPNFAASSLVALGVAA